MITCSHVEQAEALIAPAAAPVWQRLVAALADCIIGGIRILTRRGEPGLFEPELWVRFVVLPNVGRRCR